MMMQDKDMPNTIKEALGKYAFRMPDNSVVSARPQLAIRIEDVARILDAFYPGWRNIQIINK